MFAARAPARAAPVARPSARRAARATTVVRAAPNANKTPLEEAIEEAKETCESGSSGECAVAWDTVEEISAAGAHKKAAETTQDPLDKFCEGNPDADECRVYED